MHNADNVYATLCVFSAKFVWLAAGAISRIVKQSHLEIYLSIDDSITSKGLGKPSIPKVGRNAVTPAK